MTTPIKGLSAFTSSAASQHKRLNTRDDTAGNLELSRRSPLEMEPGGNARNLRDQVMLSQMAEQLRARRNTPEPATPRRPIVTLEP